MSHQSSHIIINSSFTGPDNKSADVTIDFNAPAAMSNQDVGRYVTRLLDSIENMGDEDT